MEADLSGAEVELQWRSQDLVIGVLAMRYGLSPGGGGFAAHEDGGDMPTPAPPVASPLSSSLWGLDPIVVISSPPSVAALPPFTSHCGLHLHPPHASPRLAR
ncbi:Os06g0270550 [Oryza sativa Japonica Group]|uniref:Os06g0270550 protein n=1 Tax=Oryza sativa subsp. japonica TaxID=39947 RepID=A0A0P0WVH7_ORYSJ|nr:Os06g0270550 [Oryza sativa Japonica Group]